MRKPCKAAEIQSAMNIDFKALFALSPNPYMVLDSDLTIVWTNQAYLQTTMRTAEAIFGRNVFEAFPSTPGSDSYELMVASFKRVRQFRQRDEIAVIRYDIERPDGAMEQRYWSATHTPLLNDQGEVELILQHTVDVTELHNLRTMRDEIEVVRRANAVQTRNIDLQAQIERLTRMFEQAPGFVCVLTGADHVFEMTNSSYCELVGRDDLLGQSVAEAMPEVVEQGFVAILDGVRRDRQPYIGSAQEIFLRAGPEGQPVRRFIDFVYQPVVLENEVAAIFVQGQDVTESVLAARHQDLLINELNHRVKNTLAVVQSLANQSFRNVEGAGAALQAFDLRLLALARAHTLLTNANWGITDLAEVIREATAANGDPNRIQADGPAIALPPRITVALSMALHELTTNAIKYGALSSDQGTISIKWQHDPAQAEGIVLEWVERDGPAVSVPQHKGFGTRLIERGLASEYGGGAQITFAPEGVRCAIQFRVATSA